MVSTASPSAFRSFEHFKFQLDVESQQSCLHSLSSTYTNLPAKLQLDPQIRSDPVLDMPFQGPRETHVTMEEPGEQHENESLPYHVIANNNLCEQVLPTTSSLTDTTVEYPQEVGSMPSVEVTTTKIEDEVQRLWEEEEARLTNKDQGKESTLPSKEQHQSKQSHGSKKVIKWKQRLREKQIQRALALHQHQSNENVDINVKSDYATTTRDTLRKRHAPPTEKRITSLKQLRLHRDVFPSPTPSMTDLPCDKNGTRYHSNFRQPESNQSNFVLAPADQGPARPAYLEHDMFSSSHFALPSVCGMAMEKPMRISGPVVLNENYSLTSHHKGDRREQLELDIMDTKNKAMQSLGDSVVQGDDKITIATDISCPDQMVSPYLDDNDGKNENCVCKTSCIIM